MSNYEISFIYSHASLEDYDANLMAMGLDAFHRRVEVTPCDERLQNWLGSLLLHMNRLTEAEAAFQRSIALPGCQADVRANALYNLACVYARQNNENACRRTLEESAHIKQPRRQLLAEDPDLESGREREWFRSLLEAGA